MNKILFLALMMISSIASAEYSLELIGGGLTYHVIDNGAASQFSNKLSNDGRLIYSPTIGLKILNRPGDYSYKSAAIFRGLNSVGSPMTGGILATGLAIGPFNLGFVIGGYVQNNEDFRARGIQPYSVFGNTNAFVPIAGVEGNVRIPLGEKTYLGINNILTPIITNHSLSLGYRL